MDLPMKHLIPQLNPVFFFIIICLILLYAQWLLKRTWLYIAAAKINGPIAFPIVGSVFELAKSQNTEDMMNMVKSQFAKYGSVVRIWAGPILVINCYKPEDMEIILNSKKTYEKSETFYHHLMPFAENGIGFAKYNRCVKIRRILKNFLSNKLIDSYFDTLSTNTEELITSIRDLNKNIKSDGNVDIYNCVEGSIFSLVAETLFGMQEKSHITHNLRKVILRITDWTCENSSKGWTYIEPIFRLSKSAAERQELILKDHNATKELANVIRKKIAEEALTPGMEGPKQFIQTLIQDHNFTDDEVHEEVHHMLIAGTDAPATTVNYMLMCLGIFPQIQEKVYQELMDVIGPNRAVTHEDLPKLEYLERVMYETLRLFPVAQNISRKVSADLEITNKVVLPAGTTLILAIYCTHMDPDHWPDPWRFDPDRFLSDKVAKRHPYAFLPFSGGTRNCMGYKYAKQNLKTYVASILLEFKVECGYKNLQEVRVEATIVNKPVLGYKLKLFERNV